MLVHVLLALAGVVVTTGIYLVVAFWLMLSTFSLGGETLDAVMEIDLVYFLVSLCVTGGLVVGLTMLFRRGKRALSLGALLPIVAGVTVTLYLGAVTIENLLFAKPFDSREWVRGGKPLSMAATLVDDETLVGLTRKEVSSILGVNVGDRDLATISVSSDWFLGGPARTRSEDWYLRLSFRDDTITYCRLFNPGFDFDM